MSGRLQARDNGGQLHGSRGPAIGERDCRCGNGPGSATPLSKPSTATTASDRSLDHRAELPASRLSAHAAHRRRLSPAGTRALTAGRTAASTKAVTTTSTPCCRSRRRGAVSSSHHSLSLRANSIDVDARLTPLDPPGKPAAPTEPGSPVLRMAPACGTIAFLKSDRPADPTAGERNGDRPGVSRHRRQTMPLPHQRSSRSGSAFTAGRASPRSRQLSPYSRNSRTNPALS